MCAQPARRYGRPSEEYASGVEQCHLCRCRFDGRHEPEAARPVRFDLQLHPRAKVARNYIGMYIHQGERLFPELPRLQTEACADCEEAPMIEWLAPGFAYSLVKDAVAAFRGRQRRLTPAQVLEIRQKWKPLFEEEIWNTHGKKLRKDVIIRDVRRLDAYPEIDCKDKGVSPWFRVGLLDTYHKGILVGLRRGMLTLHDAVGNWRYADYKAGEPGDLNVILAGRIPFENIEAVDWGGDEYYGFPHIYCYFGPRRKEPYERVMFCVEKCNPGGRPFYTEVVCHEKVRQLSKRLGIDPSF